jgi:hypothetical protein
MASTMNIPNPPLCPICHCTITCYETVDGFMYHHSHWLKRGGKIEIQSGEYKREESARRHMCEILEMFD